jgi:hypothetical protein
MHYLDKPRRPSIGTMGWVRIQSATRTKLGQNSTGVDNEHGEIEQMAEAIVWDDELRHMAAEIAKPLNPSQ